MSKRGWIAAVALGLSALFIALWFSWIIFSSYQQDQSNERVSAAQYEADTSEHSPISCRSIVGESGVFDWLTCLADSVSADGGVKQAEYDLKAQQDMAAWAFGMLIVTVWLASITFLGVLFVWRTLVATQKMAAATRDIGEAQVQAHVMPNKTEVRVMIQRSNGSESRIFITKFGGVNVGSTPAYRVSFKAVVDGHDPSEGWQPVVPRDVGPNGEFGIKYFSDTQAITNEDKSERHTLAVYIKFDTIFTRETSAKPERIRFDYRINSSSSGKSRVERV